MIHVRDHSFSFCYCYVIMYLILYLLFKSMIYLLLCNVYVLNLFCSTEIVIVYIVKYICYSIIIIFNVGMCTYIFIFVMYVYVAKCITDGGGGWCVWLMYHVCVDVYVRV